MKIKQLSVFVENKAGRLAEITRVLADAGIDIRAISVADTSDFGILRLIVNKPQEAVKALKDASMTVSLTDVIAVCMDDVQGRLADIMGILNQNGIGVEYLYAFISREHGKAYIILRVDNEEKTLRVLCDNNIAFFNEDDIYKM